MPPQDIEPIILRATGHAHPLDVAFIDEEDLATPWQRDALSAKKLAGKMPRSLRVTLANLVYFEKVQLPQPLANRLIRLAAFQNPEFYRAQAMRMSVWDKPRVIGCAENYPQHIALPRGCLNAAEELLRDHGIRVGAVSFDAILRRAKARFVLGLTATPIRRDGQQPIIFMQCGPIRHTAAKPANAPHDLEVQPHSRYSRIDLPPEAGIQDVFRYLAEDPSRTDAIAEEVKKAYNQGRKVLVLTERTEHLDAIHRALDGKVPPPFVLHGRMAKKQRALLIAELEALPPDAPRIVLATGKLVGEGFDHPPLDTLVLAMPVSWKGTLQQYAGRLHREHAAKTDVRIIDLVDTGHPALLRMWDKRQRGYRAMGYRVRVMADDNTIWPNPSPKSPNPPPFALTSTHSLSE
jgi:hypothetical protein